MGDCGRSLYLQLVSAGNKYRWPSAVVQLVHCGLGVSDTNAEVTQRISHGHSIPLISDTEQRIRQSLNRIPVSRFVKVQ